MVLSLPNSVHIGDIELSPILKPLYLQGEKGFFVLYLQEQTICLLHVQTRFQDLVGIILAIILSYQPIILPFTVRKVSVFSVILLLIFCIWTE